MSYKNILAMILAAAATQPAFARSPFTSPAIDDVALAVERGTFRPSALLTVRQLSSLQDDAARRDFGLTGGIGSIVMDVWWANDGAQLIEAGRAAWD